MTTNTLPHRLRTYLGGELGNDAADEIERLQSRAVSPETIANWLHAHGLTAVSAADAEKVKRCDCGWRPIETAPKSGEFLLFVWEGDWNNSRQWFRVYHAHGHSRGPSWATEGNYRTEEGGAYELAGWMPLPEPPAAEIGKQMKEQK